MNISQFNLPTPVVSKADLTPTSLEALVVKVSGEWFAVRAKAIIRLQQFESEQLIPASEEQAGLPALKGLVSWRGLHLPLLDLSILLNLPPVPMTEAGQQILVMHYDSLSIGFLVQAAQQIERIQVNDIYLLPPLIEQLRVKPVVWALWQRNPTEIISLLDLKATLNEAEWEQVVRQSYNQL